MPNANDVELARLQAAHSQRGPSGAARLTAAARMQSSAIEAARHKKNLDHIEGWLEASAIFQQIATEAALAAVTMGAGRVIAQEIVHLWGVRLLESAGSRGVGGTVVRALASRTLPSGSVSVLRGVGVGTPRVAHAAAATLGRLSAGLLMGGSRWVMAPNGARQIEGEREGAGKYSLGLLAAVLAASVRPGTVLVTRDLTRFVVWATHRAEPGALAERVGQVNQADFDAARRAVIEAARAGQPLGADVDHVAAATTQALVQFASRQEAAIGKRAHDLALADEYSDRVPFLARHTSGIERSIAAVAAEYASANARWNLWRTVLNTLRQCDMGRLQTQEWIDEVERETRRRVAGR